jgi:hypothetical protein
MAGDLALHELVRRISFRAIRNSFWNRDNFERAVQAGNTGQTSNSTEALKGLRVSIRISPRHPEDPAVFQPGEGSCAHLCIPLLAECRVLIADC